MPEVAASAEEAGEEVEGVVVGVGGGAALLLAVLGEAFVAVLVVDAAGGGVGEGVVGVGYGDEFLFGGFVAAGGGVWLVGRLGRGMKREGYGGFLSDINVETFLYETLTRGDGKFKQSCWV